MIVLLSLLSASAATPSDAVEDDPFVVVLGVAQDAGHPQAGCEKSCCAAAWADRSKGHSASSVAIVDPRTNQRWLLDASPQLPEQLHRLAKVSPGTLSGVLLTHAHIGHYTGLMHLGPEVMGAHEIPLWVMPRMRGFLAGNEPWNTLLVQKNVAVRTLTDGVEVRLNERIAVTPIQVPHRDELSETVGFVVRGPHKSVLYLPDIDKWGTWHTPVEAWIGRVDIAMLDGTFYADGEVARDMLEIPHPFISESLERFAALPDDERARVRFTHLNHSNPALNPESDACKAIEAAGMKVATEGERYPL